MEVDNFPFEDIIKSQIENKQFLNKKENPPDDGISLTIINNTVKHSKCLGTKYQKRKKQIINMFQDVVKKYKLKKSYININLDKIPKNNCFNFYREKGNHSQFLLPNPRFINDNIFLNEKEKKFNNFDEVINELAILDNPFENKTNKIYINCNTSTLKLKIFKKIAHINKTKDIVKAYMCIGDSHKINNIPKIDPSLNKIKYFVKKKMAGFNYIYFNEHCNYKYILNEPYYINTDKIRLLLGLNCVPITKTSKYETLYSYTLQDKINHIEFTSYKELLNIYNELENNNELCLDIIKNNKEYLEKSLNYDNLLMYIAILINNLFA
tara:strand:- start:345 stop:1316 length:972 start_codon:yes stop_codon:yes gene_type:complete